MLTILQKNDTESDFLEIDTPQKGCWIHVDNATTSDLVKIAKILDCEYTDIHDCLDKYEIPRIDKFDDIVIFFTRHPSEQEAGLRTSTLSIIYTTDYIITVSPHPSLLITRYADSGPKIETSQKTKLLISILLRITQEFTIEIKKIRTSVFKTQKSIDSIDSEDIARLTVYEETLNQYTSSLVPLRRVFELIGSGKGLKLLDKDQDLLEDLLYSSMQSEELCSLITRTIRSLRDSYQIIFTNQLNKTIKLLTALTIILNIPTLISSIYGMNVDLPFASSEYSFSMIMGGTTVLSVFAYYFFQKRKWL